MVLRDVGIVVAAEENRRGRVRAEKVPHLRQQGVAVGHDLRVHRVTVQNDAIGALEERAQHRQAAHLAGGVFKMEIGKDAREHGDRGEGAEKRNAWRREVDPAVTV